MLLLLETRKTMLFLQLLLSLNVIVDVVAVVAGAAVVVAVAAAVVPAVAASVVVAVAAAVVVAAVAKPLFGFQHFVFGPFPCSIKTPLAG